MLVYIHVPFCARRCSYCDFSIAVRRVTPSAAFREAIRTEWLLRQDDDGWEDAPEIETVYFGGGTPSRLDDGCVAGILDDLGARRAIAPNAEITLEANPDDVTIDRARAWVASGVNRVSLGVQAFHEPTLRWMHRTHGADQVEPAIRTLREAGVANLSLDLIYGLPEHLDRDWRADLDRALRLEPEHLSLYALTVESGTPLGKWTQRGEIIPAPEPRVAEEYTEALHRIAAEGITPYEVSNAARPGFRAVHNAGYWSRRPYLGLGPSSHSGVRTIRRWNIREWEAYRLALTEGRDPTAAQEDLSPSQVRLEELYLGLRTAEGVPRAWVPDHEGARWVQEGWASVGSDRIRLTGQGWLRLDGLVARLSGGP